MGYWSASSVPTFDFWAKHYCVCDHWFASLPLGTQANRLMAMGGESQLSDNATGPLPYQRLVYEWLTSKKIQWRAYQSGDFLPFFCLMPRWTIEIMSSLTLDQIGTGLHFRRYANFARDWLSNEKGPSVTFIEPEYTDGPNSEPNDDHAPTGVEPGQKFLADIYNTLIAKPEKWARTLLVVTYDEHGGFFDHVPPLNIPATINGIEFQTTGARLIDGRVGGLNIARFLGLFEIAHSSYPGMPVNWFQPLILGFSLPPSTRYLAYVRGPVPPIKTGAIF